MADRPESILPRIIDSLANQALEALDLATAVGHPGESGRAREEVIRRFLAAIVPPDSGIDTGFVVDAVGGISKQIDIVVYRKSRYPILDIGGVKHFMVESVAAVFEVKSIIGSRELLVQALENVASVKALDRTGDARNVVLTPGGVRAVGLNGGRIRCSGESWPVSRWHTRPVSRPLSIGWKRTQIGVSGRVGTTTQGSSGSTTY